jgi:hypothetical protein
MLTKTFKKIKNYISDDIDRFLILCLIFSLPFDRIPSVDILGLTIRLSVVIGALLIIRTLYLILNRKISPSLNGYEKVLALFIVWVVLLLPESINFKKALVNIFSNIFVILMAYSVALLFKKKYIKPIIYSLLISACIAVLFGIYQYIGDVFGLSTRLTGLRDRYTREVFGFPRIQAFSLEPLYFASYLLLPFSVVLATCLNLKQKIISSKLATIMLFLFSFGIFMTVSRGGIYGLVACFVFILVMSLILKLTNFKRIALLVAMVLFAFGSSLLVINYLNKPPSEFTNGKKGASAYVSQIKNTGLDEGDERAKSRAKAITILKQDRAAIIIGIGPGQYGPYVQNNQSFNGSWTIVNNLTLELWVETGIIGLSLFVLFMAILSYKGSKLALENKDVASVIIAVSICGYFVSQAIQYQAYSTLYIVHFWTAIGLLMGLLRQYDKKS